jgi:hypothetical protein
MIRATRSVWVIFWVLVSGSLVGCGGESGSSTSATAQTVTANPTFPITRAPSDGATASSISPTISGVPATTAIAGQAYNFQPNVANAGSAAVSFSVLHAPVWAKFDSSTGTLSGTPSSSQIGKYTGISISMTAGTAQVTLPAFTITVAAAAATNNVTLSWQPPTENADGTPLVDLKGFRVHYGPKSQRYSDTIQVSNPGLTTFVVQNLQSGKYYFAVTAYNAAGQESSFSPEVSTQVD